MWAFSFSGRFVALTVGDLMRFRLRVRWSLFLFHRLCRFAKCQWQIRIAMLSISFYFFCPRLFVRSWACVLFHFFFVSWFVCSVVFFGHACIGLAFVCARLSFPCICVCDVRRCYLLVTTLRVHPAETRLTVYRRPYILQICKFVCSRIRFRIVFFHVVFDWRCQNANEFAQQKFVEHQLHVMVARKFEKLKIS